MSTPQNDISTTIGNPLQGGIEGMKQTLKAKKTPQKKNPNHISIEEDKWETKLINNKKKALEAEENQSV